MTLSHLVDTGASALVDELLCEWHNWADDQPAVAGVRNAAQIELVFRSNGAYVPRYSTNK